jgi:hypothetical protein
MIEPCDGLRHNSVPVYLTSQLCGSVVAPVGLPATIRCEPRQTRKGAAAAADSGAGERWAGAATISSVTITINYPVVTKSGSEDSL